MKYLITYYYKNDLEQRHQRHDTMQMALAVSNLLLAKGDYEIEHDISENVENKTIRQVIDRWWMDTFTSKNMWSANECIDDLADQIEFWILRNKK